MRIQSIRLTAFKRFTDLTIHMLPSNAKLIVLVGPNGCGKSSLFDALNTWQWRNLRGISDTVYFNKDEVGDEPKVVAPHNIDITLHQPTPTDHQELKRIFYIRSAYRNESDFAMKSLQRLGPVEDRNRVVRLIDNDTNVSTNYQSIAMNSLDGLYSGAHDDLKVSDMVDLLVGDVRRSMKRVFPDLVLRGVGNPMEDGTFLFDKGVSSKYPYKNLSGGEKAAFDLLLDFVVKVATYNDTVFCIDEPEAHMNTRLQGILLRELVGLLPDNCQLWIATHSIGMMREAWALQKQDADSVVFLDFFDKNFDRPVTMAPAVVDRRFWQNTLDVALGDLAELVAPRQVVLCEGRPATTAVDGKAEFDARCFRTIFATEYPDTSFISVGNAMEVRQDTVGLGATIEALTSGTKVIRLIDRDDLSDQEVSDLVVEGVRALSRRHLEAYLYDNEILGKLATAYGHPELIIDISEAKREALDIIARDGKPDDDVKSASGRIYVAVKRILGLTQVGNSSSAFMRDTLAPLMTPETITYKDLKRAIFDE